MTSLKRIPVRLAGTWQPVQYVGHLDWMGTAVADEPITAVALCRDPSGTSWSRVGRGVHANELKVSIKVRPGSGPDRLDVAIWLTIDPGARATLGNSRHALLRPEMRLTNTAPFMISSGEIMTGEVSWFVDTWTAEHVRLGALFVAESDVRHARNGLWHLRKDLTGPNVPLTAALNSGRKGHWA